MIKVIELFGGIGAPRKALERLGIDFGIVDYVEIDKHAVNSYNAMYNENYQPQDINKWVKNVQRIWSSDDNKKVVILHNGTTCVKVDIDLIFHGSPCQDFSLAGLGAGGEKGSGTRSSLLWKTIEAVEKIKPKIVIWENVKGVLNKKNIDVFNSYLSKMDKLGYYNTYDILNAKNFGVPQNRERVFVISILHSSDVCWNSQMKKLPIPKLETILEDNIDEKYYINKERERAIKMWNSFEQPFNKVISYDDNEALFPTIRTRTQPNVSSGIIIKEKDGRYRWTTPLEHWRAMGFDDIDYKKASEVCSKSQLYKQAGNSIVVNVLESIFKGLF